MILTIDIGNSRTKWAVYPADWQSPPDPLDLGVIDNQTLQSALEKPVAMNQLLGLRQDTKNISRVLVCNVAVAELFEPLMEALKQAFSCEVSQFKTQMRCAGLVNGYKQPELLGQDRWAAMLGAWHRLQNDCLVICAGSALTVDVIEVMREQASSRLIANHRGGVIAPGYQFMKQALFNNTAQLATRYHASEATDSSHFLGLSTAQAIDVGVELAWSGVVAQIYARVYAETQRKPMCLITGGDAELLAKHLQQRDGFDNNVITLADLIFEGMLVAEREQACAG